MVQKLDRVISALGFSRDFGQQWWSTLAKRCRRVARNLLRGCVLRQPLKIIGGLEAKALEICLVFAKVTLFWAYFDKS